MYQYPFRKQAEEELHSILGYWQNFAIDDSNGGFYGKIDNQNIPDKLADKGSVLNARILWSFSAAYNHTKHEEYRATARRAYDYFADHFIDAEFGGVYWTVTATGDVADSRKQLYASAFGVYGISEYHRATLHEPAKKLAIELYKTIVRYGYDNRSGGFYEAFTQEWKPAADQRLSAKDANEAKSTNTNLHILEAFSNLYAVWPDDELKQHISSLLSIFDEKIIDPSTGHLHLFFDEQWNSKPDVISYGHDIEAAWLLTQCAQTINDKRLTHRFTDLSVKLTNAAMEGLDDDGGLWYEYDPRTLQLIKQKHWWPQSEAVVGFYHAWQITNDEKYVNSCVNSWKYILSKMKTPTAEWYWGRDHNDMIMNEDKVGLWKCPYHNSRACLELIKRSLV